MNLIEAAGKIRTGLVAAWCRAHHIAVEFVPRVRPPKRKGMDRHLLALDYATWPRDPAPTRLARYRSTEPRA